MHSLTIVSIWYEDKYGKKWEYITRYKDFRNDAAEILEKHIDNNHSLFYTINDNTYQLDYYNTEL